MLNKITSDPFKLFEGRRAGLIITYNDKDISVDASNGVISMTYTSNASGEVDSIELSLEDRDGKWQGEWYPQARKHE